MQPHLSTLLLLLCLCASTYGAQFPANFMWGTASAAFQIEGAYLADGKGLSIWDVFLHDFPNKTVDGATGDVADDHYHRVPEDTQIMQGFGLKNYMFSFAWARIMPTGRPPVNQLAIDYYNAEIDMLIAAGITPFGQIYVWDLPQALDDLYGGFLSEEIVQDFVVYSQVLFDNFGDRIKYWMTINEPVTYSVYGYGNGVMAPGRCSNRSYCAEGNSSTEPYLVAHNSLLAHAAACKLFHENYDGQIGITLNFDWSTPLTNSTEDIEATLRDMLFTTAWFSDPLYFGQYPDLMRERVGSRLPNFTAEQSADLMASCDYFGLNHYTSWYTANGADPSFPAEGYWGDKYVVGTKYRDGVANGPFAESTWLTVVPSGIRFALNWIKERYNNPPIIICENGVDVPNESLLPIPEALNDTFRINYINDYLEEVSLALNEDGVNVTGYFLWSFLDNLEWGSGFACRFGLVYIDHENNLTRYPKASAKWFGEYTSQWSSPLQIKQAEYYDYYN